MKNKKWISTTSYWWESTESNNDLSPGISNVVALSRVKQLNGEKYSGFQRPGLGDITCDGTALGEAGPLWATLLVESTKRTRSWSWCGAVLAHILCLDNALEFNLILSWDKWILEVVYKPFFHDQSPNSHLSSTTSILKNWASPSRLWYLLWVHELWSVREEQLVSQYLVYIHNTLINKFMFRKLLLST